MTTIKSDAKTDYATIDVTDKTGLLGATADILYAISELYKMLKEKYSVFIADACIETIKSNVDYMRDQSTMEENVKNNSHKSMLDAQQKCQILIDSNIVTKEEIATFVNKALNNNLNASSKNDTDIAMEKTIGKIINMTI